MKKSVISSVLFVFLFSLSIMAQMPPHPNGGIAPGPGNIPVGGGAPIGGSFLILLFLSFGYGFRKVYDFRKKYLEENY
jgi:hypothetical protein